VALAQRRCLLFSAGVLLFSIITVRREHRVRPGLDLLRLVVTIATTVLMAVVVGVTTPEALMGAGSWAACSWACTKGCT